MSSHMYKVGGEVRLQGKGGPAGLRLTGTIARKTMGEWRKEILRIYKEWNIPSWVLARYVDDCTNIQQLLRVGVVWDKTMNKLRFCPDKRRKDLLQGVTEEQTTATIWREVASSIIPGIKFTIDCPTDYKNGMVPILDFQAKLIRENLGLDPEGDTMYQDRVEYQFFKKPTANWLLVQEMGALPNRAKFSTLAAEV